MLNPFLYVYTHLHLKIRHYFAHAILVRKWPGTSFLYYTVSSQLISLLNAFKIVYKVVNWQGNRTYSLYCAIAIVWYR